MLKDLAYLVMLASEVLHAYHTRAIDASLRRESRVIFISCPFAKCYSIAFPFLKCSSYRTLYFNIDVTYRGLSITILVTTSRTRRTSLTCVALACELLGIPSRWYHLCINPQSEAHWYWMFPGLYSIVG